MRARLGAAVFAAAALLALPVLAAGGLFNYAVTEQAALKTAESFAGCPLLPAGRIFSGEDRYVFEGEGVTVEVTVFGGAVVDCTAAAFPEYVSRTDAELVKAASEFLRSADVGETAPESIVREDGMAFVRMLPVDKSGVLLYPDAIVVDIRADTLAPVGYHAENYVRNHRARFLSLKITEDEAKEGIPQEYKITGKPTAAFWKKSLYWRFLCEREGERVYCFVSAESGEPEFYIPAEL